MKVFVILKCGYHDAANFIKQIAKSVYVSDIMVFREESCGSIQKTRYVEGAKTVFRLFNVFFRLIQILKNYRFRPEVIIGIYEIPHGLLAVISGVILGRPSIVSVIGNPGYTKLRKGIRLKITILLLKYATYVTVTGTNSKKLLQKFGIDFTKIFVLPNTMSFEGFENLNIQKEYDIISLGRLSEEKRLDVLINVVERLKIIYPSIKAAIAGAGPERPKIEQLIKMKDLEENIDLVGFVKDIELVEFFNKGRVFVLTSETEGFPRTIVQAAACGTPVVSCVVGDISDILINEKNSLTIDRFDDLDSYVVSINRLLLDTNFANGIAQRLNADVRQKFSVEEAEKVWSEIFSKIAN